MSESEGCGCAFIAVIFIVIAYFIGIDQGNGDWEGCRKTRLKRIATAQQLYLEATKDVLAGGEK